MVTPDPQTKLVRFPKTLPHLEKLLLDLAKADKEFDIVIKRDPQGNAIDVVAPIFDKQKWSDHRKGNKK